MSKLSKINLFELSGIYDAPEEEKQQFLLRVTNIAISRAIERAITEKKLSIEEAERISSEESDPIKIQTQLIQLCPLLPQYTEQEVDLIKVDILKKQIEEALNISSSNPNEVITDLQSYINFPIEDIDEDVLLEKVGAFRTFQNNLLNASNING